MEKGKLSFGSILRLLRIKSRHTQREVAEELEVPHTTYKSWEYGKSLPRPCRIDDLISFFENYLDCENMQLLDDLIKSYEDTKIKEVL